MNIIIVNTAREAMLERLQHDHTHKELLQFKIGWASVFKTK